MENISTVYDASQMQRMFNDTFTQLNTLKNILPLQIHNAAPAKPTDGDVVYADGTDWNPGSGEGIYARYNSTWNKL